MTKQRKQKPWWTTLLLMAVGAMVGYLGASYFLGDGTTTSRANDLNVFLVVLIVILAFFLVVLIHELGHLIGGLLMGNEFSMVIVGPFKLQKEDGKYSFTLNKSIAMAGGLALTLPTKVEGFKKRRLVTIGGGPLASLLLAIVAYVFFKTVNGQISTIISSLAIAVAILSAFVFIMTIIPMKAGGFMSDGMQLLLTLRNDAKAKQYADFMSLFALDNKGTSPKDLPLSLLEEQIGKPIEDIYDFSFQQYLYYRAIDNNEIEKAETLIQKLEDKLDLYPSNFQPEILAEWAIFYSVIRPDTAALDKVLKKLDGKKPTLSKAALHTFEAALAHQAGNQTVANEFAQKVFAIKELKGTTKLYQAILRKLG